MKTFATLIITAALASNSFAASNFVSHNIQNQLQARIDESMLVQHRELPALSLAVAEAKMNDAMQVNRFANTTIRLHISNTDESTENSVVKLDETNPKP